MVLSVAQVQRTLPSGLKLAAVTSWPLCSLSSAINPSGFSSGSAACLPFLFPAAGFVFVSFVPRFLGACVCEKT